MNFNYGADADNIPFYQISNNAMPIKSSISVLNRRIRCFLFIGSIFTSYSNAATFEFNTKVLQATGIDNIDLSAFSGSNDQFTGEYLTDVVLNNQKIFHNFPIHIYTQEEEEHICFTEALLTDLPISKELRAGVTKNVIHTTDAGKCYGFSQYDPAIATEYDSSKRQIILRVPHIYIVDFDRYWTPPHKRDYGISGIVLDYNLLKVISRAKKTNNEYKTRSNFSSYGALGFNLGRFRFRTNYQYNPNSATKKFERTQTYAFTDIGSLNAQMYAGELYSRSNLFGSVPFKGISLFTNENMMPSYLQGYAPQITGTANSDAIVTIRQYGNIIKQIQVPPGSFAINNLPSYLSGTIDVSVEESDGSTHEFQVEITSVPFLTRKGALRYTVNAGEANPKYSKNKVKTKFISIDGSYGLSNTISLNSGINFTTNREFLASSFGLGINLGMLGGLSFDITHSENKANPDRHLSGQSYRFNYAKRFTRNTSLNIVGYRFSSREYTTLNNYIDIKGNDKERLRLEKNRFSVSVSQYIPTWKMNLTVSGSKSTYWNTESNSYYNISLSKTIQKGLFARTSISLNLGHNKNNSYKDNRIGLFVSIPLADNLGHISYNASYDDSYNNISQNATYYNEGFGGNYSVGVSMNHQRDFSGAIDYSLNASYNTRLAFGNLNSSVNYRDNYQYMSTSFNGSLTLTQHGLAIHPYVFTDSSRLIINTGTSGVGFEGNNTKSDIFGLAGISNIPDYNKNTYKIDIDNLPENVDIPDNVFEIVPTKGAIAYRDSNAISGDKALINIVLPDGSHPPFGSTVYRKNGIDIEVGIVAENGLTYIAGLNKNATFIVKWGQDSSCKLKINSTNLTEINNVLCN